MNSLCKIALYGFLLCMAFQLNEAKHVICYEGQSYWCQNITTAAECNAVNHCIHSVWEKEIPIEMDLSSVCQTCIDMVELARDQLNSNQTQEELKQALEGTCMVIPEKHLKQDCDKLMDDFGSYLVDTLSSQMNPSTVCSVAGLCFNKKFLKVRVTRPLNCDNCHGLMKQIEGNIGRASTSYLKEVLTVFCRSMVSYTVICASLLDDRMDSVDAFVRNNIRASPVCGLSGICAEKYHSHARQATAFQAPTDVQVFDAFPAKTLQCDLCQELVDHLRNALIANTTVEEFKMVLDGLCKMSRIKDECDSIIDQYYASVFKFLVNRLDGRDVCKEIKMCNQPIEVPSTRLLTEQIQSLPLQRMKIAFVPQSLLVDEELKKSGAFCSFCEYFLHFVQQDMTLPSTERKTTDLFEGVCNKLPATVKSQCDAFVDAYTRQFIALLANKIDPSQICPSLGVCPGVLMAVEYKDTPTCPLCLLAFEEALKKVQSNRSESVIGDVLDDLCMRDEFPTSVLVQCAKFVTGFKGPITDMIIADFTPQEACVYVDLCSPPQDSTIPPPKAPIPPPKMEEKFLPHVGDVETNEINEKGNPNACVLCEFVMEKLAKMLADKKTEEEIKQAILNVCSHMPKTISGQCKSFVSNYADMILNLIVSGATPKLVCTELSLCANVQVQIMNPIKRCVVCEIFMDFLKTLLTNEDLDATLNSKMVKACDQFPLQEIQMCKSMIEQLGPQMEAILRTVSVGPLACRHLHMCPKDRASEELHLLGMDLGPGCHSGAEYWCATSGNAVECDKIEYCQTNVWRSDKPGRRMLKGSDVPSH